MALFNRLFAPLPFLLACGLAASACRRLETKPLGDLLGDTAIAEKHGPGTLVEFGSPSARPYLGEGWSYGEQGRDGSSFRWAVGKNASFEFENAESGARVAWVECEPYPSADGQSQIIELTVNGAELPPLTLREGRGRYPLELNLEEGRNSVEMRFSHHAPGKAPAAGGDRRKLAVAFHRWEILPGSELSGAGRPGPFSIVRSRWGTVGMILPEGGAVSYYTRLPEGARLVVRAGDREPRLATPPGAVLNVSVLPFDEDESDEGAEIVKTRQARSPRGEVMELDLPLQRLSGKRARLTLAAQGKSLFVVPVLHGVPPPAPPAAAKPARGAPVKNVLLIVLDGASAQRMSPYGYRRPTTPVLERLAAESAVFETAITQAVYTIASVGSILTGEYPERHQSVSFADRLPASAVTLPGLLTLEGFRTAGFAGNAVVSSAFGLDRGYQEFHTVSQLANYTGRADSVTRLVLPWIEKHRDQRFFAYVHFREPHFPYIPPPPYDRRFGGGNLFPDGIRDWETLESINRAAAAGAEIPRSTVERVAALYEGSLAYVDAEVGKILRQLETLGLAGETALLVTADHGEALFEHRYIGHNTQLYEESVRVPLLLRAPGIAPRRVATLVELIDLFPTVLELAGARRGAKLQGRSLLPLARGENPAELAERLAFSRTLWDRPRYSARDRRFKYIWDSASGAEELYDLNVDPGESLNRAPERPLTRAFFRQQLFGWLSEQERLRSGASAPESSEITEDLGKYLGTFGYVHFLKKKEDK